MTPEHDHRKPLTSSTTRTACHSTSQAPSHYGITECLPGFYEWRDRPASATARRRARLATLIEWIFNDSDHTYGHRRIHAALHRQGERLTPELVRSIMRELGLIPCQPRPFRTTTTVAGDPGVIPDLLARDFHADAPGTKLVGDITY